MTTSILCKDLPKGLNIDKFVEEKENIQNSDKKLKDLYKKFFKIQCEIDKLQDKIFFLKDDKFECNQQIEEIKQILGEKDGK